MINKESIISAFTDRCTLLKWLKKVEAALKESVLDDVAVNQISETQVQLEFKFADGTSTLSPVLTLPKGEKGDPGEPGEPGKDGLDGEGIAATVEVGTVTTGAPGSEASVTNSGTEQRAILNFVIPRGDPGSEGSAGVGFDDATLMEFNQSAEVILGTEGFTAEGYTKVTAGAEIFEIPSKMIIPVGGSDTIIVDVNETGTAIEIHLEAEILAKINRALLLPTSAPASVSLVAIDANGGQTIIAIGDGLEIVDGVLKIKEEDALVGTWVFNDSLDIEPGQYVTSNSASDTIFCKLSIVGGTVYSGDFSASGGGFYLGLAVLEGLPPANKTVAIGVDGAMRSIDLAASLPGATLEIYSTIRDFDIADTFLPMLQANATKQ